MEHELVGYRLIQRISVAATGAEDTAGHAGSANPGAVAQPTPTAEGDQPTASMWRAERLSDGVPVAIKVFPIRSISRADREAEVASAVGHCHIVQAIDRVIGPDHIGLVFPWIGGGSLADLIEVRRRLRWPETLTVLIPLADALAAADERGFVHGDISPANVLFDASGRPVLIDFGAARAAVEVGGDVFVTPGDVAPEIVRGAVPAAMSDLFSLGSVALACLTGRSAWFADNLQDVMIQSAAGQWPDIDDNMAPQPLVGLVRRLLSPEPADRGSAAALAVDLREIGDPEPVELVPAGQPPAVTIARAATTVRPDAVRPPAAEVQSTPGWPGRGRPSRAAASLVAAVRRRVSWRGLCAAAVVSLLVWAAVAFGWSAAEPARSDVALPATSARLSVVEAPVVVDAAEGSVAVDAAEGSAAPRATHSTAMSGEAPSAQEWFAIVRGLDEARAAAIVARDPEALRAVYVDSAAAAIADAATIARLQSRGLRVEQAAHVIRSVTVIDRAPDGAAIVGITEEQPSYPVYDESGGVVGHTRATDRVTIRLYVQRVVGGFRISDIESA